MTNNGIPISYKTKLDNLISTVTRKRTNKMKMKPSTLHRRRRKTIKKAVLSLYQGMSLREAVKTY